MQNIIIQNSILFLAAHGTFSKIDNILGHKQSLTKYKKIQINPCTLSDHNGIKLEPTVKKLQRNFKLIESEQYIVK
jgi:hypothetical protein